MGNSKKIRKAGAAILFAAVFGCFAACGGYKEKSLSKNTVLLTKAMTADESVRTGERSAFTESNLSFATEFFKKSYREENTLVSPLSLAVALAMTANGARGKTREEMENVFGIPMDGLNGGLSAYTSYLGELNGKDLTLSLADSIWVKEDRAPYVSEEFLQTNKNYYDAEIFSAPFDGSTLKDVNTWTENKTKGMIKEILEKIDEDSFLYLINALYFSGQWEKKYEKSDVRDGIFTAVDGTTATVEMMDSEEWIYLSDENTTGFVKPYKGGKLAFAALLPDEDVGISEYVAGMSQTKWKNLFEEGKRGQSVKCSLPAFSYDFSVAANDILAEMGMPTAFDETAADFTGMYARQGDNAYIGGVLQKTRIEVDEAGTKAAAVTIVDMSTESCPPSSELRVVLDRPFVYAIVDTESYYPLFLGAAVKLAR